MKKTNKITDEYIKKYQIFEYSELNDHFWIVEANELTEGVNDNIIIIFDQLDYRVDGDCYYINREFYRGKEIDFIDGTVYLAFKDYIIRNLIKE